MKKLIKIGLNISVVLMLASPLAKAMDPEERQSAEHTIIHQVMKDPNNQAMADPDVAAAGHSEALAQDDRYVVFVPTLTEPPIAIPLESSSMEPIPLPTKSALPEIAIGYEDIYERFLKGVLVYRPTEGSDVGKIELPIAALANPLEGTFDLSSCGDAGQYLSIATGYRKGMKSENANRIEIWITPRFLVDGELSTMAANHHLRAVTTGGNWDGAKAPVGIFWTWGGWNATDNMQYCDYLTSEGMADWGSENLYKKYEKAGIIRSPSKAAPWRPGRSDTGWPAQQNFTFHF